MFRKTLLPLVLAFFTLMPFYAYADPQLNHPAPALIVKQLDGQTFNLAAAQGHVVIVNFWATWCPPCREEMPLLNFIYKHFSGQGLAIIGLSADREKNRNDVIAATRAIEYPAAMLNEAQANDFGWAPELPLTYVIDRKGILRAILTPDQTPMNEKSLIDILQPLLGQ